MSGIAYYSPASGAAQGKQAEDTIASAASVALAPVPGANVFEISGTTAISYLSTTNFQNGSVVTLLFQGAVVVTNGGAAAGTGYAKMLLAGGANWTSAAGELISLMLCEISGVQCWRELYRMELS